jgi:hypothetical protein
MERAFRRVSAVPGHAAEPGVAPDANAAHVPLT